MDREVYDENGNLLTEYDLSIGKLVDDIRTVHHDAVEAVEEVWHYETMNRDGGGETGRIVIDVPGAFARDAWDEEIPIQIYVPYTQEELDRIEAERNKPTDTERISQLESEKKLLTAQVQALSDRNDFMEDCIAEMATIVYA